MNNSPVRLQVLRCIDKLGRLTVRDVFDLLTEGRMDESGAFTPGCGLPVRSALFILSGCSGDERVEQAWQFWIERHPE